MKRNPYHRGFGDGWLAMGIGISLAASALFVSTAWAETAGTPTFKAALPEQHQLANLSSDSTQSGWFQRLFQTPLSDGRKQAIEQIEALGLGLDANSCIRAVAAKNRRLIELYIKSGFDLNASGAHGATPLLTAALAQDWETAALLLGTGATPNCADESGATPLMAAALHADLAPLKSLLQAGADSNARDRKGHTALHYAVSAENADAVTALLGAGAKVAGTCCEGHDLLAHALEARQKSLIVPILAAQAGDLDWTSEAREILEQTIDARDADYTRLFFSKFSGSPNPDGKEQPILAYAILDNDIEKFRYLLGCGADPNTPLNSPVEKSFSARVSSNYTRLYLDSEAGMNTLMLAAGLQRVDFARALIDAGAKRYNSTAKYKLIPVYFAARLENPEMLQLLIGSAPAPEEMRIEISLGAQRAYLYKNNVSTFSTPISSGRSGLATPTGKFVITDKHLMHRSTLYPADMPFFMRLSYRDFGMHQGNLPGYPASHGCIRLPTSAAKQLYKDVPVGTLVSITQ